MQKEAGDECAESGRLSLELLRALGGWSSGILSLGLTFTSGFKISSRSCQPAQEPPPSHSLSSPSSSLRLPSPSLFPQLPFTPFSSLSREGRGGREGGWHPLCCVAAFILGSGWLGRREGKWVSAGRDRTVARGQGSWSLTPPVRQ